MGLTGLTGVMGVMGVMSDGRSDGMRQRRQTVGRTAALVVRVVRSASPPG